MSLFFKIILSDNLLCIKFCLQIFKVLLQLSIATPLICLISDARAIDMHPEPAPKVQKSWSFLIFQKS